MNLLRMHALLTGLPGHPDGKTGKVPGVEVGRHGIVQVGGIYFLVKLLVEGIGHRL